MVVVPLYNKSYEETLEEIIKGYKKQIEMFEKRIELIKERIDELERKNKKQDTLEDLYIGLEDLL